MNPRRWALFYALCAGLAVIAASVGGVALLRVSARERAAVAENQRDQLARLALARMDAVLVPLVAREGARPYFEWRPFYSAENAYTGELEQVAPGAVVVASPLLTSWEPWNGLVHLYFELEPDGTLRSPQAPEGNARDLAESGYVDAARVEEATLRLGALRVLFDESRGPSVARRLGVSPAAAGPGRAPPPGVTLLRPAEPPRVEEQPVEQGPLVPMWIGVGGDEPQLVLVRAVRGEGRAWVQGLWIRWDRLAARLEGVARQVLPEARVVPVLGAGAGWDDRRMLSAPIGLEVPMPATPRLAATPGVIATVAALLAGVVIGVVGVGLALRSALDLAGRRGRFVSAVTHELRTPLTTFQLYSQMLASGMVRDEEKRQTYLRTLQREAQRLHGIVESVLLFARLNRGDRVAMEVEPRPLDAMMREIEPSLRSAAGSATLALPEPGEWPAAPVLIDAGTLERVLVNLVTNAVKYAEDAPIRVWARTGPRGPIVLVGDDGPGIPRGEERRVFQAFHRAARHAGSAAPGLGLGLSLARELLRRHGGNLTLERRGTGGCRGAVFAVRLVAG